MNQLKLKFIGEFNDFIKLNIEISDLGHQVIHSDDLSELSAIDYVIFFQHAKSFFWLKNHPEHIKKAVFPYQGQIINLFNSSSAYVLNCMTDSLIEDLVDAIIVLSQNNFTELNSIAVDNTSINDTSIATSQMFHDLNNTYADYAKDQTISQLFEAQVARTPNSIALVYENTQLTYSALNQKANKLAHYLKESYQVRSDDLIALCLDRSELLLIAIFGVLKSGAAYVPLDASYPDERIRYILEDVQPKVVLSNELYINKLDRILSGNFNRKQTIAVELIDSFEFKRKLSNYLVTNLVNYHIPSTSLAYVLYTSGTTGKPKGIMVEHKSVINLQTYEANLHKLEKNSNCLWFSNYVFDAHVLDVYLVLLNGHTIHIATNNIRYDINLLAKYVKLNNIVIARIPPALLNTQTLIPLKKIVVAGETCSRKIMEFYAENNVEVINAYGPTEATVCSTLHRYKLGDLNTNIGKPIANVKVYVLSSDFELLPLGSIGELYIGGAGLARGYLNLFEKTQESFIPNPFQTDEEKKLMTNQTLYKTGDLVRINEGGDLEYIGRNDTQVKIRGHRIELAEIEFALGNYAGIDWVNVLVYGKNESDHLIAFYSGITALSAADGIGYLKNYLPDYMLPSQYIKVDKIPLTINGKVDKNKLIGLILEENLVDFKINSINPYQQFVGRLWNSLLPNKVSQMDGQSNFLELGGNSLLITKILLEIQKTYQIILKPKDIFENLTLGAFADLIESLHSTSISEIDQTQLGIAFGQDLYAPFPLTKVQEAYLLGRENYLLLGKTSTHIYQEVLFSNLDIKKFELAWNEVIKRHHALRIIVKDNCQQILSEVDYYSIETLDHSVARELMSTQVFNVAKYPLFNIKISHPKHGGLNDYQIHFSFDAIIIDVYSLSNILHDLHKIYNNKPLPDLLISFRDCVLLSIQHQTSDKYLLSKEYWKKKLPYIPEAPKLPYIINFEELDQIKFNHFERSLDPEVWLELKRKSAYYGISPTTIFLFLYGCILSRFSETPNVLLNLTLFNRDYDYPQIEEIVGDFTTLELFGYIQGNENTTLLNQLKSCQNELWQDLEHKNYDGISVIRDIRNYYGYQPNDLIAPYVFTSALGRSMLPEQFLNPSFKGVVYEEAQTSQCILDNIIREYNGVAQINWYYLDGVFAKDFIQHLFDSYVLLVNHVISSNWETLSRLPLISPPPTDAIIIQQANSSTQKLSNKNLFELFEENVLKHSDNIAVIDLNGYYSYQQILDFSLKVANKLTTSKSNSQLIAILSQKGYQQVSAIMGVLANGKGYLPLHVEWPLNRINEVLQEGLVTDILISRDQYAKLIQNSQFLNAYAWLIIEDIIEEIAPIGSKELTLSYVNPAQIAYVIFTSGSSGKPKGVTISHLGALNTILAVNAKYKVNKRDRILALSELSFDLSVYDIFGMLFTGATIVFPDQNKTKQPAHWLTLIKQHEITIWNTVPQLAELLIDELMYDKSLLSNLRLFLLSGDWIPLNLPKKIQQCCLNSQVISLGGATEASIWSVWYEINTVDESFISIPYGVAMPNQYMYVLNNSLYHCALGVMGEIYIGGIGVALNYWRDESKTQDSFIQHPSLGRIYKTGDLGKWSSNGYIEFYGRKDSQVKINGYRVELEEVSANLIQLPGVESAIVNVYKHGNNNYLIGYLQPKLLDTAARDSNSQDLSESNKVRFRLLQKGLANLDLTYILPIELNETEFCLRKSYRNFKKLSFDNHLLQTSLIEAYHNYKHRMEHKVNLRKLRFDELNSLFSLLSGLELTNKGSPKYLYPSGGSSYGVRSYISVTEPINEIASGYYYYHPLKKALCTTNQFNLKATNGHSGFISLDFMGYLPAIKPLYGDFSSKLAYLEMGHMLGLILDYLDKINISYELIVNQDLNSDSNDEIWLGTLNLCTKSYKYSTPELKFNILTKINGRCEYVDQLGNVRFQLEEESIFIRSSHYYQKHVLEQADKLLSIDGEASLNNLVVSGILAQKISQSMYAFNVGSCMLGVTAYGNGIYAMALGVIDEAEKRLPETKIKQVSLTQIVTAELSQILPEYMLPYECISMAQFPLTSNGKVALDLLPKPDFNLISQAYIAPNTKTEQVICGVFAEILHLKSDAIGLHNSFFKLGGTSISAIQLASMLSKKFNTNIVVADIFSNTTPLKLANYVVDLIQQNSEVNILKEYDRLNDKTKPLAIFIHSGAGGSEVYQAIADRLKDEFFCIGVDNHNFYNQNKITSVSGLAEYYISLLDEYYNLTNLMNALISITGWSLGGCIAYEMGRILEERGAKNLKLVFFDSLVMNDDLIKQNEQLNNQNSFEERKNMYASELIKWYDAGYAKRVMDNYYITENLFLEKLTGVISQAKCLLFKATQLPPMQVGSVLENNLSKAYRYMLDSKYNNFDTHISLECFQVINLPCHHQNILDLKFNIDVHLKTFFLNQIDHK